MSADKPLGGKAYGSIPHLPGSKFGNRDDKGLDEKAARFFTGKAGKQDRIIVLEKLDGSCVSVANVHGEIVPLIRSGYRAITSKYLQHHFFVTWVDQNQEKFEELQTGERICGEWLAQAHGTKYNLDGRDPFVPFDFFIGETRQPYVSLQVYCEGNDLDYAPILAYEIGTGTPIEIALEILGKYGYYGAVEPVEGCVWRWERNGQPVMMAKYVRPESEPGRYLEGVTKADPVWNWKPTGATS